jgi:cytochrome P450
LLLFDPALYARIRGERRLLPTLVEESLRFLSPAQSSLRRCTRDVELSGVQMRAGDKVEVGIASGNRDEEFFDDPASFRLDRHDPRDHLAFGAGPHVCPGASLARMETTIGLEVFFDRVLELTPLPDFPYEPVPTLDLSRPRALPVSLVFSDV